MGILDRSGRIAYSEFGVSIGKAVSNKGGVHHQLCAFDMMLACGNLEGARLIQVAMCRKRNGVASRRTLNVFCAAIERLRAGDMYVPARRLRGNGEEAPHPLQRQ